MQVKLSKKPLHFLITPILNCSQGRKILSMGHCLLHTPPLHKALANAYNIWKSMGGTQKGATLTVQQLLKLLSPGKINAWELAVQGVYAKGTPQFVSIFPRRHKSFQIGETGQRIEAVNQLGIALNGIAPLATTLTDVQNFYAQLSDARSGQ
jgi:hypothetical protein